MMDLRAYAAHRKELGLRGTSHVAVLQAIQGRRLVASANMVDGRWQIDPELADREWAANTKNNAPSVMKGAVAASLAMAGSAAPASPPPPPPPPLGRPPAAAPKGGKDPKPSNVPDLLVSESVKRACEAKLRNMDVMEREARLIEVDRVRPLLFARHRQFRDGVQGIPARVVDSIAAALGDLDSEKRHKIREIVAGECRRVMEDLSTTRVLEEMGALR